MTCFDEDARQTILRPSVLFGDRADGLPRRCKFAAGSEEEYCSLVLRQLRSGKVRLASTVKAAASTFTIGKKGGLELREIYNGTAVTEAALPPPKPPWQATPAALTELEASLDRPLWLSGRDARVYFDQLAAPPELQPYLGRPSIQVAALCRSGDGLTPEELSAFLMDGPLAADQSEVIPVGATWPMGFGWSSFVAQSYMVDCVSAAGFAKGQMLTEEGHLLDDLSEAVTIATDDVLHFFRGTAREAASLAETPLTKLDRTWEARGVLGNDSKSFDLQPEGTALGIDFVHAHFLRSKGGRVHDVVRAVCDLADSPLASPLEVSALLGIIQWQNLLNRPLFSCLSSVYDFTGREDGSTCAGVPDSVVQELLLNTSLLAFWNADLARPWWPCMPATDASAAYGFGMCLASCEPALARTVARHAGEFGNHLRLTRDADDPLEKPRGGRELRLPLKQRDFIPVFAIQAQEDAHSGSLEATGVVLGLRRLSRKRRWHGHRGAFLVDAQVVMSALQKGRSSAGTIRHQVCQAGALTLACNWKIKYCYLPSESNPADDPSRGVVRCRRPGGKNGRIHATARPACLGKRRKTRGERSISRFIKRTYGLSGWASECGAVGSSGCSTSAASQD